MNTWYSTATPEGVARIEAAWADAPTTNLELCELIFETAREQVIAYAPAPGEQEGEIVLGPTTLYRRNLIPNPRLGVGSAGFGIQGSGGGTGERISSGGPAGLSAFFRRVLTENNPSWSRVAFFASSSQAVVGGVFYTASAYVRRASARAGKFGIQWQTSAGAYISESTVVLPSGVADWSRVSVTGQAPASAARVLILNDIQAGAIGEEVAMTGLSLVEERTDGGYFDGSTPPLTVDDRTYSHAWEGVENASASVETYRPFVFVPMYPTRLVYAQLQQARNLWLAGRTDASGDIGGDFSYTPRPLDKTIRSIIRPESVAPSVF